MKIKLTEQAKRFIESLTDSDKAKLVITEDTVESLDEEMTQRLKDLAIDELKSAIHNFGEKAKERNAKLRLEHPEYFK